jgi:hypothetical protein
MRSAAMQQFWVWCAASAPLQYIKHIIVVTQCTQKQTCLVQAADTFLKGLHASYLVSVSSVSCQATRMLWCVHLQSLAPPTASVYVVVRQGSAPQACKQSLLSYAVGIPAGVCTSYMYVAEGFACGECCCCNVSGVFSTSTPVLL